MIRLTIDRTWRGRLARGAALGLMAVSLAVGCGDDGDGPAADAGDGSGEDGSDEPDGDEGDGSADGGADGEVPGDDDPAAVAAPADLPEELRDERGRLRLLPRAVALQGDALIVAGQCGGDMCAVRLSRAGSVDDTFGEAGVARIAGGMNAMSSPFLSLEDDGAMAVLVADDAIYLGGYAQAPAGITAHAFAVAKLDPDGAPDPSFGRDGLRVVDANPNDIANAAVFHALHLDEMGRLYGIGQIDQGQDQDIVVARFSTAGALDPEYPPGNPGVFLDHPDHELGSFGVATAAGLVVGGGSVIARLDDTGVLDESFDSDGFFMIEGDGAQTLIERADGKLLAAAFQGDGSEEDNRVQLQLVQISADGVLDEGFGTGGVFSTQYDLTALELPDGERLSGQFTFVRGMTELASGELLLYTSVLAPLSNRPALLRLQPNGVPASGWEYPRIADASLPLLQDLGGPDPASLLVVAEGRFYIADWRVDDLGGYLSLWSDAL